MVTLIRENLNAFNVSGKDEWQKIAKVLSRFANMPEPEYREDREYVQSVRPHAAFDNSRYEVKPINPDKIPAIFQQRGLSDETVRTFAPFIRLIRDKKNENFDGYNIGFLIPTENTTRSGATKCEGTAVTSPRRPEVILPLPHG